MKTFEVRDAHGQQARVMADEFSLSSEKVVCEFKSDGRVVAFFINPISVVEII